MIQIPGLTNNFINLAQFKKSNKNFLKRRIFGMPGLINHFDEFGTLTSRKFVYSFINVEIGTSFCRKL
jgi:hypothetical protein